jgi:C4-dicarboxylate-specific signal transduction histidine kinase
VQLLRAHEAGLADFLARDPKGRQVPAFLAAVSTQLDAEQAFLAGELRGLQQNVEHIKHIVSTQQSFAKLSGTRESLALADLAEDALRIHAVALTRHGIEIVRDFAPGPAVTTDRHKVLQILVNLVGNAKHALNARAHGRRLTLRLRPADGDRVRLEVADNGMGIAAENLARIFNHGFTTKKDGHGFGLHSGANSAKELGGSLAAASAGPGLGATFTLELPLVAAPAATIAPFPLSAAHAA